MNLRLIIAALSVIRVRPLYNCSQDELYAICLLISSSYNANQPSFELKKAIYTVLFGTNLRAQILAAKALPDFEQRGVVPETFNIQMKDAADEALIIWQELDSLISSSFPANLINTNRQAAGHTHYAAAAAHDWEEVSQLMQSGSTFITANTGALTTGGMVATFAADFDAAKIGFDKLYDQFKDAEQDTTTFRNAKITANNDIFIIVMKSVCVDGKKYFRKEPAIRQRFTWSKVKELVSGAGSKNVDVVIPPAQFVSVPKVIVNSAIVNTGTVPVFVCSGNAACDVLTSVSINPGDQITNTFGPTISLTNPDAIKVANIRVRVVQA